VNSFVVGCKRRAALLLVLLASLSAFAGQVTLAWNPSEGADGYRIYWGTQPSVYTRSNDVGPATGTTVTGLVNTVTYYFAVTAYNVAGESDFSTEVSTTIPPLPAPEYLQMAGNIFCWSIPSQSDVLLGFCVYREEDGVLGRKTWRVESPDARSLEMADMLPGSSYRFWVVAYTTFGNREDDDYQVIRSGESTVLGFTKPLENYLGQFELLPPAPLVSGGARITFFDSVGDRRQVWGSFDLEQWERLGEATELIQGQYRFIDALDAVGRFYRIEE